MDNHNAQKALRKNSESNNTPENESCHIKEEWVETDNTNTNRHLHKYK